MDRIKILEINSESMNTCFLYHNFLSYALNSMPYGSIILVSCLSSYSVIVLWSFIIPLLSFQFSLSNIYIVSSKISSSLRICSHNENEIHDVPVW